MASKQTKTFETNLYLDDYIILIGSSGKLPIEFWKWNGSSFDVTTSRFETDDWRGWPNSFIINDGDFGY